jgi:hypothetical protein
MTQTSTAHPDQERRRRRTGLGGVLLVPLAKRSRELHTTSIEPSAAVVDAATAGDPAR